MTIIKAGENELEQVVHLALLLWPENEPDDLKKSLRRFYRRRRQRFT